MYRDQYRVARKAHTRKAQASVIPAPHVFTPPSAPRPPGSTMYRDQYRGHNIDPSQYQRAQGARPYNPNSAPFEGNSSYKQVGHLCGLLPQHTMEP